VYSFFKKDEIVIGNTALSLGEDETESTTTRFQSPKIEFAEGIKFEQTPLKDLWNKLK
jgi:hypothetical protein